jgi:hypothetical protein
MRAPEAHEKGLLTPRTVQHRCPDGSQESAQDVNEDARPPLHLLSATAEAGRQGGVPWARARRRRGVVAGVATTTVGADPTGCGRICHL